MKLQLNAERKKQKIERDILMLNLMLKQSDSTIEFELKEKK